MQVNVPRVFRLPSGTLKSGWHRQGQILGRFYQKMAGFDICVRVSQCVGFLLPLP